MKPNRHPIGPDDLDVISAIWMLSCNDPDAIMTYKGIEDRLELDGWDVERVIQVVRGRAELFSPVVSSHWLDDWKKWVKAGGHYPRWVLRTAKTKLDRDALIDALKKEDVFRCQLRVDDRPAGTTDPCVDRCKTDEVKLGLEHIDRLRKAGAEARDERLKRLTTVMIPILALILTSVASVSSTVVAYGSLQNSRQLTQQTADLTRADELVKLWDLNARATGTAYEDVFNSLQSAMDAAAAGNERETQKQLNQVRSDFFRLETIVDDIDARKQLWTHYDELKQLCSDALKSSAQHSGSVLPAFENLRSQIHDELYKLLFARTPDEEKAYRRLMRGSAQK